MKEEISKLAVKSEVADRRQRQEVESREDIETDISYVPYEVMWLIFQYFNESPRMLATVGGVCSFWKKIADDYRAPLLAYSKISHITDWSVSSLKGAFYFPSSNYANYYVNTNNTELSFIQIADDKMQEKITFSEKIKHVLLSPSATYVMVALEGKRGFRI